MPPSQAFFPGSLTSEASPAQDGTQHPYPPIMHPNMMPFMSPMHMQQMMHQQQLFFAQQRQLQLQQQHQQHQDQNLKQDELPDHLAELRLQATTPDNMPRHNMDSFRDGGSPRLHSSPLNRDSSRRSPLDRHSMGSVPFGMGVHNPMMHPPMFNSVNPNFDPSMVPVQTPNGLVFVPINRMTPPPGFGHFPMPMSDQGAGSPSPQPGQLSFHSGFHHHPQMHHQMFMQHHLQAQNRLGSTSPFSQDTQRGGALDQSEQSGQTQGEPQNSLTGATSGQPEPSQQHQIKDIENQINHLLFSGEPSADSPPPSLASSGNRPLSGHLTVQEIEKAQEFSLHNPGRRVSLADPVTPPRSRSIPTVDHLNSASSNSGDPASTLAAKVSFNTISSRHVNPTTSQPQYDPTAAKAPFSVKDIDFYSDRKYDPYRPSLQTFDLITRDASFLCAELLPNPAEETRKLALLQR